MRSIIIAVLTATLAGCTDSPKPVPVQKKAASTKTADNIIAAKVNPPPKIIYIYRDAPVLPPKIVYVERPAPKPAVNAESVAAARKITADRRAKQVADLAAKRKADNDRIVARKAEAARVAKMQAEADSLNALLKQGRDELAAAEKAAMPAGGRVGFADLYRQTQDQVLRREAARNKPK